MHGVEVSYVQIWVENNDLLGRILTFVPLSTGLVTNDKKRVPKNHSKDPAAEVWKGSFSSKDRAVR